MQFDRVLADVPCTGDGTIRKNKGIWKSWTPLQSISLHRLQISILTRGIELLKTGGRIVYSTCSLNPVENEAVVASLLNRYSGKIRLLDMSDQLPGLIRRNGLNKWNVMDSNGSLHTSTTTLDPNSKIPESAFSPENSPTLGLEKCIRILPFDQVSHTYLFRIPEGFLSLFLKKLRMFVLLILMSRLMKLGINLFMMNMLQNGSRLMMRKWDLMILN